MIGTALKTLCISVNGDSDVETTLLSSLLNVGKAILEGERDWVVLRKLNTAITVSASAVSAWNTAISLATITDFMRFYEDLSTNKGAIKLFDGSNRIQEYRQVPFDERLKYRDSSGTFVHDVANNQIYLNGTIPFAGTLYISYIRDTIDVDLTSATDIQTAGSFPFPTRFHPILAFYAIGMNKGAIDYDSINKEMLPSNQAILSSLKSAMIMWDTNLQLSSQMASDPTGDSENFQSGAINMTR